MQNHEFAAVIVLSLLICYLLVLVFQDVEKAQRALILRERYRVGDFPHITEEQYAKLLHPDRLNILHHTKVLKTVHLIQPGESLLGISLLHLHDSMLWPAIALVNAVPDRHGIETGDRLLIPTRKASIKIMERIANIFPELSETK